MPENRSAGVNELSEPDAMEMEGWLYRVRMPTGYLLFYDNDFDFELAWQHATGEGTEESTDDHPEADRIDTIHFAEPTEVPISRGY